MSGYFCQIFKINPTKPPYLLLGYVGNNVVLGQDNPQPSAAACARNCAQHSDCVYWTWGKAEPTGPCYLKGRSAHSVFDIIYFSHL
jgi:hypothetical protein